MIDTSKFKSVLKMECCHCRKTYGHKDGGGQVGVSHGTCDECAAKGLATYMVSGKSIDKHLADIAAAKLASLQGHVQIVRQMDWQLS